MSVQLTPVTRETVHIVVTTVPYSELGQEVEEKEQSKAEPTTKKGSSRGGTMVGV